jgi:Spy/CpxP family protein refolding chaperone
MKKLLLVALLAIGTSAMSLAQGGPGGGGRPPQTAETRLERLKGAVTGITADQETKLKVIYTAQIKSQDSLRTALGQDMAAYREKLAPITATYNAKIKAVLTAEQQKAFDAMPQGGRGPGGGGGAPGGGGPRP